MRAAVDATPETVAVGESGTEDVAASFFAAADRHPDRPAVIHNGETVSYSDLATRVRRTARLLGDAPGTVGVLTERSPRTVEALLGIWTAGGAYCPIDPLFPVARQQAMVEATGSRTVLGSEAAFPAPDGFQTPFPADGGATEWPPGAVVEDGPALSTSADPEAPAYVLFTSGSTGAPKPVVTPRRAIRAATAGLRELFGITPEDRVLQFASLNWDTCFEELLPALTTGAAVVFDDEAYVGSLPRFLRMVDRRGVTVLDLPSAFWHELVHHLRESGEGLPASVRLVVIGGEAVHPARLADWRSLDTEAIRLLNTYGTTETTLVTHGVDLHGPRTPTGVAAAERVPIGRPLPAVRQHVGEDGELWIGGPQVAAGYLGLPEQTAARFVRADHGDGEQRWFRTGDRVEPGPEGTLLHAGRVDGELKVRGIRVDPAEVEAHIAGHPLVEGVAVSGVLVGGHTSLAAHVVLRAGADAAAARPEILAHLRATVPNHLVPARIQFVPELVRTASGKIDRAATAQEAAG